MSKHPEVDYALSERALKMGIYWNLYNPGYPATGSIGYRARISTPDITTVLKRRFQTELEAVNWINENLADLINKRSHVN